MFDIDEFADTNSSHYKAILSCEMELQMQDHSAKSQDTNNQDLFGLLQQRKIFVIIFSSGLLGILPKPSSTLQHS